MARAKKKKTKKKVIGICRLAGKNLAKNKTGGAGTSLARCRWSKKNAKPKQSRAMKIAWKTSPKLRAIKTSAKLN